MVGILKGVDATETLKGVVLRATNAETIAGTDVAKYITSAALSAKLGDQTSSHVAVGAGKNQVINWAEMSSADGSIGINYNPSTKKVDFKVLVAPDVTWFEEELEEQAWFVDPANNHIYYCNADSPVQIQFHPKIQYNVGYETIIYSMQRGFELINLETSDGGVFRIGDQFSTAGTGKVRTPKYGTPEDRAYVYMKFFKNINTWVAVDFYPKEGWIIT